MDFVRLSKWTTYFLTIDEEDTFEMLFVPYLKEKKITLDESHQFSSENLKRKIDDDMNYPKVMKTYNLECKFEQGIEDNEAFDRPVEFHEKFTYSSIEGEFIQVTKIRYDINCDEDILFCELTHDGKSLMKYTKIDKIEYYEAWDGIDMIVDLSLEGKATFNDKKYSYEFFPADNYNLTSVINLASEEEF